MSNLATKTNPFFVTIGSIGRPYGTKGWMKINSFTDPPTNIIQYDPWYLLKNSEWQQIELSECKMHGNGLIARIIGCQSPEHAQTFVNLQIGIKREQLPPLQKDQYYWTDLIGLSVYNHHNQYLGNIDHLFETGANDVIVVKNSKRDYLIPYVMKHVILSIDLTKKTMIVNWDEDF